MRIKLRTLSLKRETAADKETTEPIQRGHVVSGTTKDARWALDEGRADAQAQDRESAVTWPARN